MVNWIGYDSPNFGTVLGNAKADVGAEQLAVFLETVEQQNSDARLVGSGHSYAANMLVEALKLTSAQVDSVYVQGPAGIRDGTSLRDLDVDEFYVATAEADRWAWIGTTFSGRVDPSQLMGATEISAEDTAHGQAVTGHSQTYANDEDEDGVGCWDLDSSPLESAPGVFDGTAENGGDVQ